MAKSLLDLRTDLKSLKYQGPNGSNPPYVTKDINNPPSNSRLALEATARIDDTVRVGKALLPTNSRFIENQLKLNAFNTQNSVLSLRRFDVQSVKQALQGALQRGKEVGKVTLSTLAQTAAAGTGFRLGLGFKPTNSTAGLKGEVLPNNNSFIIKDDLLSREEGTKLSKDKYNESQFIDAFGNEQIKRSATSRSGAVVEGGEEPVLSDRAKKEVLKAKKSPERNKVTERDSQKNATKPVLSDRAKEEVLETRESEERGKVQKRDSQENAFDKETGRQNSPVTLTYKPKVGASKIDRTGLGDQSVVPKPGDYKEPALSAIDRINAAPVGKQITDDLIKFYFKVVTPELEQFLTFRAYLTDFSDSYQGNWSDTQYIGRADKVYNYTGFSRSISLSFTIAASTRAEMKPLYNKIVYLASTTAPTYGSTDQNFMRGTIVELTVGDYLANTPGVITSVNYKWQQNYPWEIVLDPNEEDVQQLPMVLDCSIEFKPIHTFIPQTGLYPYISDDTATSKILDKRTVPNPLNTPTSVGRLLL